MPPRVQEVGPREWLIDLGLRGAGTWGVSFVGFFTGEQAFDIINGSGSFWSDVGHVAIGSTGTALVTVILPTVNGLLQALQQRPQRKLRLKR